MSGQLVSQDWQPALRNQRRRLDQTSRGKASYATLPQHSSYGKHTLHTKKSQAMCVFTEMNDISWMISCTQNIWDSSVTTDPTTMSLLAVIQLWGKQFNVNLTKSFIFSIIVLMPRDTSTWAGSLPQLSVIFLSPKEKTGSGFIMCLHPLYAHTLSQMSRDPSLIPFPQEEWEPEEK